MNNNLQLHSSAKSRSFTADSIGFIQVTSKGEDDIQKISKFSSALLNELPRWCSVKYTSRDTKYVNRERVP